MEAKSSVVKSKSSNSPKTNRIQSGSEHHKKSRSNAEIQPYVLKKRGVYVERKAIKTSMPEPANNQAQERPIKAPPRPRAGSKSFLDSVWSILSKSTTGTQYPEKDDPAAKKKIKRRTSAKNNDENTYTAIASEVKNEVKTKIKTKYRSKALNDEVAKEVNQEQVEVLQEQRDMIQTPSIYSENDSFNWSNLPLLVEKKNQENKKTAEANIVEVSNELAKEIIEEKKLSRHRKVRIDEPITLVAEQTKKEPNKERHKEPNEKGTSEKDKKLYNFFVDLLETSISDYNVKAEYDKTPISPSEGSTVKIPLEMDESVAKKLTVKSIKPEKKEVKVEPQLYCLKDLEFEQGYASPPPQYIPEYPRKCSRKKKFLAESYTFLRKPHTRKLTAASEIETKKYTRKQRKKTLLNLFKEQLRIDSDDAFEEPQNLYQALKVIAKNKRRCQKTIHFEDSFRKKYRDMGYPECMFKMRKVISPSRKSTKKIKKPMNYAPSVTGKYSESSSKKKHDYDPYYDASCHSLEVYGFDFKVPALRAPALRAPALPAPALHAPALPARALHAPAAHINDKQLLLTYHSPSASVYFPDWDDGLTECDSIYLDYNI